VDQILDKLIRKRYGDDYSNAGGIRTTVS
jgi:hypothetical protein